jgi:ATP-dependent DNA helicase RecQ
LVAEPSPDSGYNIGEPADHDGQADHGALPEPDLTATEAALLPAKLLWSVVAWNRGAGRFAEAAALIDELESRSGPTLQAMEERARLLLAQGLAGEAIALQEERVELSPVVTARTALARMNLEVGNLPAAAELSAELSREHPESATSGALAADVARASGDLATARAYYEGVLEDKPQNVTALVALARIALLAGKPREAAAVLEEIVALTTEVATPGQLFAAAAIAELCDQPVRSSQLRSRAVRQEAARAVRLAQAIDLELGRQPTPRRPPAPRPAPLPEIDAATADDLISRLRTTRTERLPLDDTPAGEPAPAIAAALEVAATAPTEPFDERRMPDLADHAPTAAAPEVPVEPRVLEALQRDFGHVALRPGQAAVIANVLAGRDTLAIMPTGAGKSLTFQLPAMLRDGTTLVLSPLIALMKDQVESLPPAVRERTALLNSTLSAEEQRRVLERLADGDLKLVYAAPERLRQHAFLRALRAAGVALVVVDEAHCISLWGHDFRPDYLSIPAALPELGAPPVLAITATATPRMAAGIAAGFGRELDLVRTSVFRPNLFYEVHHVPDREAKLAKVVEICREERGAGIVYVSSRKDAEAIAGILRDRGIGAIPYHAGLDPETRAANQERFMGGRTRVVVATVAFGMGVDKRDVRFIVHLMPPRSLEAYAQESGRAGRDGLPARCVLLTAPTDRTTMARQARRDELDLDTLRRVYAAVKRQAAGRWATVDPETLLPPPTFDDDPDELPDPRVALGLLEQGGLVRRHPDAPISYTLRWAVDPAPASASLPAPEVDADATAVWERFARWAQLDTGRSWVTIRTAEACDATGLSPVELSRLIGSRTDLTAREGPRQVCLELLPAGDDAALRLSEVLARTRQEAQKRIAQVLAYAGGGRCRHVILAGHLGESLVDCGSACDICIGTAAPVGGRGQASAPAEGATAARRSHLTGEDALAALTAVRTLPFPMGKAGLTKLLLGSVESRVRADRSPAFGALTGVRKSKVEGLLDRLVEDEFLERDLNHEFRVIRLTARGAAATLDDLGAYDERPPQRRTTQPTGGATGDAETTELSAADAALLERLSTWRRERASREALPPYIIAHNATLREIAWRRPATLDALAGVNGFGRSKIEKYGDEILALVADG